MAVVACSAIFFFPMDEALSVRCCWNARASDRRYRRPSSLVATAAPALLALALGVTPAAAQEIPEPLPTISPDPAATAPPVANDPPADVAAESVETPSSTEQGRTTLAESFEHKTRLEWARELHREALQGTKFQAEIRSFYLDRTTFSGTESEAWTLGGSVGFKTGYFLKHFALGAVGYTSQRLYGPADKDGTQLLKPGQEPYSVLGELYGEFVLPEGLKATAGRWTYDTPYIGRNDSRMTPNTFEAYALEGWAGGGGGPPEWHFGLGYFDKIKDRNSDEFVSMAQQAGAPSGVERGVWVGGGHYQSGELSIGAINYYSSDIIDIAYLETRYALALIEQLRLQLAAQYTEQHSVGGNLLTGSAFSANQFGLKAELARGGVLLSVAYTGTGHGANMRSPWSGYPGYTSVQVQDFNRAGEDAWMLRAAYSFKAVRGLEAYALYVDGSKPDAAKQYARQECDLNVQWKAAAGRLKGLTLRARYGHSTQDSAGNPQANDYRLILYYTPPGL